MHLLIGTLFLMAITCGGIFLRAAEASSTEETTVSDLTTLLRGSPYGDEGDGCAREMKITRDPLVASETKQFSPEDIEPSMQPYEREPIHQLEPSPSPVEREGSSAEEPVSPGAPPHHLWLKKRAQDAHQACTQWIDTNSLKMFSSCQEKKHALEALQRENIYSSQKRIEGGKDTQS